jgi:hypothetical protein
MYVRAGSPKYFCRKCRNKIPIVDLESIVKGELKLFFGQRDRVFPYDLTTIHNKNPN